MDLEHHVNPDAFDRLVLSGDISNCGDKESLLRAKNWLYSELEIGGGRITGLRARPWSHKLLIVPGNHDAFNRHRQDGLPLGNIQRAIDNYNDAFPQHAFDEDGCDWQWIDRGSWGVFVAMVNSCLLGDPELEREQGISPLSKVARGKLSTAQSAHLLQLCDWGRSGKLVDSKTDKPIDDQLFSRSFKVLVMHHYLFEPPGYSSDFFLRIDHRDKVFQNLAMADFDVLLCGHRHVPDVMKVVYGNSFDPRGRARYSMNYLRRLLGLASLPVQIEDRDGRLISKMMTIIVQFWVAKATQASEDPTGQRSVDALVGLLEGSVTDPGRFKKELRSLLSNGPLQACVGNDEVRQLHALLTNRLPRSARQKIARKMRGLRESLANLQQRPFVQAMAGSCAKAIGRAGKTRAFHRHDIVRREDHFELRSVRYLWNQASKRFERGQEDLILFPHSRIG